MDSPALAAAVARDFNDGGAALVDIGLCGTEEVYFQAAHRGVGGGIDDWRFNLRSSNIEPLLRLNVETRGDEALLARKTEELHRPIED
jgi:phosphomannomutase